jgi:hypothetical protein
MYNQIIDRSKKDIIVNILNDSILFHRASLGLRSAGSPNLTPQKVIEFEDSYMGCTNALFLMGIKENQDYLMDRLLKVYHNKALKGVDSIELAEEIYNTWDSILLTLQN